MAIVRRALVLMAFSISFAFAGDVEILAHMEGDQGKNVWTSSCYFGQQIEVEFEHFFNSEIRVQLKSYLPFTGCKGLVLSTVKSSGMIRVSEDETSTKDSILYLNSFDVQTVGGLSLSMLNSGLGSLTKCLKDEDRCGIKSLAMALGSGLRFNFRDKLSYSSDSGLAVTVDGITLPFFRKK